MRLRRWHGTVPAAAALVDADLPVNKTMIKLESAVMREDGAEFGRSGAVARAQT